MNILSKLLGNSIVPVIDAIGNNLDKLFTSDEEKQQAKVLLEKIKQQPMILQTEINKLEAQHRSVFVAGWRPAIGWVLAISLFFYYVPQFVLGSALWAINCYKLHTLVTFPLNTSGMTQLIIAMLGMGTLRTVEKLADKTR